MQYGVIKVQHYLKAEWFINIESFQLMLQVIRFLVILNDEGKQFMVIIIFHRIAILLINDIN